MTNMVSIICIQFMLDDKQEETAKEDVFDLQTLRKQ